MLQSPLEGVDGEVGVVGEVLHRVVHDHFPFMAVIDYGNQFVELESRMPLLLENFGEAGDAEWQLIGAIHLDREVLRRVLAGQLNIG